MPRCYTICQVERTKQPPNPGGGLTYVTLSLKITIKPSTTVETGSLTWYLTLLVLGLLTGFLIAWLRKIFGSK